MRMYWSRLLLLFVVTAAAGKGKKHRHHKPGRALLDRLSSDTVSEVTLRRDAGLLPAPLDVALYSTVTANATCGEADTEEFCRETPGKHGVVCDVCEGLNGSPSRRHPPSHASDGDPTTWWQSPTLATGEHYRHVDLIATLPDEMELLHVIIKSGPSPRPLAWSLEVSHSEESDEWRMIRAFGDREHCRRLWDLRPERRRRKARGAKRSNRSDKPTCSTQFTSPRPLENGEMHVGVGEGVIARRVRISLRATHAAPNARRYYTIRALTLAARCLCHGRASLCHVNAQGAICECVQGSCGAHCEKCCSGVPWSAQAPCPELVAGAHCSCGERGACSFDDSGGVLCVNCSDNRAGPLCDRCLTGYYSETSDGPCLPCNCDPIGSDGTCEWDRRHHQVSCRCRPGFTGFLCDGCDELTVRYPHCDKAVTPVCKCDPRGIIETSSICSDVCECKANVVGERCDACKPGHFGLSAALAGGCRPCYCSHLTESCSADPNPSDNVVFPLDDAWMVTDGNETLEATIDEQGKPYLISYEVEGWETFYWLSSAYSGERLSAYGGELQASLVWGVVRGDTGGNPTLGPDFILIASDGTRLTNGNTSHEVPGPVKISVPVTEGDWYIVSDGVTELATRHQLMDVLRDLHAVMIRAHFHMDQDEVRIEGVELRGAAGNVREICACPPGYAGPQCARCAWTHARVQHAARATPGFECVPCACNGHAHCDTVDGPCGPCQHNTTGQHCERCLPGHYGNPVQGACKPCACPLYAPSNNFSPNCVLAGADGDDYVCTQCPEGYTGDHCESCEFGYYGSPEEEGSACRPCECDGAPCDRRTGLCFTCPQHTEGARCEQCQEGYWFGPEIDGNNSVSKSGCVACACGAGSLAAACDARSGQCACKQGWTGRACDVCASGYGGVSAGCPACGCGLGARGAVCDAETGVCECSPGTAPPHCDVCLGDHYGITSDGCQGCNCSAMGSEGNACDIRTGQCRCKPHITGRACDTCEEGYWGLQHGGCRQCECGAGAAACDPVSGECACAPGVTGRQCDRCLQGYYGFSPTGCLPCPVCKDGKVCSPDSGRCVCPGRSRGPGCRLCAPGYWAAADGCQPCNCGPGAVADRCEPHSGECKCRIGWSGLRCDVCAPGYFGDRCRPCLCSVAGTRDCDNDNCTCDARGNCPCKENVEGAKCDRCVEGAFGLSATSPTGCTACFCFGRSAHCTQAGATRAEVHAPAPLHLTLARSDLIPPMQMDQNSLLSIHTHSPDATISVPWPPVPVYVELDDRFTGDKVTSYGGLIKFKVEEEGGEQLSADTLANFPLVRLYSKHIVLDYFQRVPPVNGTHLVRLHESLWNVRTSHGSEARASRGALMLLLQQLQQIVLRITTRAPTHQDNVHALLLNVSLDTAIPGLSRSEPALGVEVCACGSRYAAWSCQLPALGYWLPTPRVHQTLAAGTILIALEGDAQPCQCNGRATACDPVTGHCLNCTEGTGGPQCERCAEGQFGAPPPMGDGCSPCPCPSRARNFATSCELSDGLLQCLCKPGYSGAECAQCATGYRRTADGACASCACSPGGAASPACDAHGRCHCRPHAAGDRCDRCQDPRALLDDDGCKPCDNCTQTLLDSVEELTGNLMSRADITELSRIPHPFPAVREFAANASTLQMSLNHLKKDIQLARRVEASLGDLEAKEHIIFTEANTLKTDSNRRQMEAHSLALESMSGLEEVLKTRRKLGGEVEALNEFARGEKHLSAHRALKEARHLLRAIKEIKLMDFLAGANDVFDTAYVQSTAIDEYKYRIDDLGRRVRTLHSALERWESKAEDINNLTDSVWSAGDAIGALQKSARPRLAAVKDVGLRCRLLYEDIIALAANNLTDDAASLILSTRTLAINFPPLIAELEALTLAAEEKEGILYNLTPNYRKKYLQAVEKHVALLSDKAKEYKRLFAGTRALAASGVSAATAWAEVAENVRAASDLADTALSAASAASKLAAGPTPLLTAASNAKEASRQLKARGSAVLNKAEELRVSVEQVRRGGDVVSVSLRALGWAERALNSRPSARVSATLAAAGERADRVFATTRALYDEASELGHRVRYALRPQLADLQRHGDSALGAVQEHVSQIRSNTVRGAEVSEALEAAASARAREHSAAAANLGPRLAALRDAVARAKDAADSISVSLSSPWDGDDGAGCSRSYRIRTTSAVTRLALAVTFDALVADGTLLYMRDDQQESKSFLKLSVEDKKLQLRWQLGAGVGMILHPENLQAAHDETDHTSYRIDIERIWNTVHMTVERAGSTPLTTSNSSAGELTGLRASRLWVGGAEGRGGLPACLHALYCDDIKIGLWNFADQPAQARCTGCTQRWYSHGRSGGAEPTMASFNGEGYAELRRSGRRPSDRRQFSLAFTFRTRDEDALLFMAVDAANNRSVTVRMRRCRVELSVQYADARLRIAASGRHCHGRPVHVQAIRVFAANRLERGSLRVNGEETLGSPSPPVQLAAELPDLSTATYWVGGVPPGAQAPAPPLLGCIGALTVDREGYDLLDTSKRHGVEARCGTRTLRSVMLQESGYVELPSPIIRRKADVGVTFLARSSSGLLLFRAPSAILSNDLDDEDPDDKHYLAINMVEGELEVIGMAGRGEARARTNGTRFDDQRSHTLRLRRAHKQLDLWVDERKVVSVPMAGSALAARSRGLYVGGLPAELSQQPPASLNLTGFIGTIADLIIDGTLLGMETGVRWEHAQLGRRESDAENSRGDSLPRLAPHASHALHARPSPPAGCTRTPSYTVEGGAVKFGDAAWSHASLRLPPTCRDLAVALQFRTFTPDGLLLLVPGSKSKPKLYLALVVRDGKLKLIVRGRKRREVALPDVVNDGTWRSVSIRASRSRVVVSSGGAAARAHAPPLTRSPRAARLYVGGVPPPPALPHLPKALLRGSGSGSGGGFRGCVRHVAVCGRAEDLVREADAHHRVRQCFPNVEKGAYFGGDAYAVWSSSWPPAGEASRALDDGAASEAGGTSVVLRLQFRTYEPNGVLIAAHGLLLELREGLVVLTRQWSGGAVRAEARGAGGRAVCDGGWHAVEARGARAGGVALSLDGAPAHRVPPPALLEDPSPAPPAPLYIGGLPEGTVEIPGEEGRENFKGCLREVTIDELYKDWLAMDSVHNVLLDSCPVQ